MDQDHTQKQALVLVALPDWLSITSDSDAAAHVGPATAGG